MKITKYNLKEIIKVKRKFLNISRKDICKKLGFTDSYITNIEIGRRNKQYDKLFDLFEELKINIYNQDEVEILVTKNIKLQEKIECLEKEILDFKRTIREKNLLKHFKK